MTKPPHAPRVFVSYAHETPEHKNWVKSLATDLRTGGIDALLDEWQVDLGEVFTLFMDKIRECDRVLLVCTPTYCQKSNEGEGGVGYERSIITAELAKKIATAKFVCVLRAGGSNDSVPTFAQGRRYIDFRTDADYEVCLDELLRGFHDAPKDPEPPIGENPFSTSGSSNPETAVSEKCETRTGQIMREADSILSRKDLYGWNRLLRRARQTFVPDLIEWRETLDPSSQNNEDDWQAAFSEGVCKAEPLFVLALSAVESDIPSISDQTSLIDDLLHLEGWDRNGVHTVVHIPAALGFLYHHLLGGMYLESKRHDDAIRLLTRSVRISEQTEANPLWKHHELMGWVESLGRNCITSWQFVQSLWASKPWLSTFFRTEKSFVDSYRAYVALASCIELASFLGEGAKVSELEKDIWLDVPAMFVHPVGDRGTAIVDIVNIAIPDQRVLKAIISVGGCREAEFREAWATWYKHWLRFISQNYGLLASRLRRSEAPELP